MFSKLPSSCHPTAWETLESDGRDGRTSVMRRNAYLVRMPKPGRSLLLTAHERNPFATAATQSFPHVEVAIGSTRVLGALECGAGGCADPMCERLVVPEGTVLEHQPPARLAETAPPLTLIAVSTDPSWGIEIAGETNVLRVGHEIRVCGLHVRLWWSRRLFLQRRVQVRWVGDICKVRRTTHRPVRTALQETKEAL